MYVDIMYNTDEDEMIIEIILIDLSRMNSFLDQSFEHDLVKKIHYQGWPLLSSQMTQE